MHNIAAGAGVLFTWHNIVWLIIGVVTGFLTGVIPGVGGTNTAALLLPFSIPMANVTALIFIGGVYSGGLFSGSVPAILVNVPGESSQAATTLDGYPLARQGRGHYAIGVARMASTLGGALAGLVVLLALGPISAVALKFGPREVFLVAVLGLGIIVMVIGDSPRKGAIAALTGLLVGSMSANVVTGVPRFTLGFLDLYSAIPFVPVIVGLFGIAEMLRLVEALHRSRPIRRGDPQGEGRRVGIGLRASLGQAIEGTLTTLRHPALVVRSAVLGILCGMVPGIGTTVGNWISYGFAKRFSKHPDTFGKGNPEGLIAVEACDNAVASGALIPTFTLGIPGSATAAVILAAMYVHGLQPGPSLLNTQAPLVYGVLMSMFLGSLFILPLGILLAWPLVFITQIRHTYLVPAVLLICFIGVYSTNTSVFEVRFAVLFGVIGYVFKKFGYPVIPLLLALILGPIAESSLLQALKLGNTQVGYFFDSGISIAIWIAIFGLVAVSGYRLVRRSRVNGAREGSRTARQEDNRVSEEA